MGLAAATALQILLISGGALGVLPLSGVVTPFLSYGRTAMLANFLLVAILLSISARGSAESAAEAAQARSALVAHQSTRGSIRHCRRGGGREGGVRPGFSQP